MNRRNPSHCKDTYKYSRPGLDQQINSTLIDVQLNIMLNSWCILPFCSNYVSETIRKVGRTIIRWKSWARSRFDIRLHQFFHSLSIFLHTTYCTYTILQNGHRNPVNFTFPCLSAIKQRLNQFPFCQFQSKPLQLVGLDLYGVIAIFLLFNRERKRCVICSCSWNLWTKSCVCLHFQHKYRLWIALGCRVYSIHTVFIWNWVIFIGSKVL